MNWLISLKGKVRFKEPLKKYTTFEIGGPAKFFVEPHDFADLKLAVTSAKKYKIPIFLLGAGSNILVSDDGVDGMIIRLSSPIFKEISNHKNSLVVGSGLSLRQLVREASNQSLSGVEFLAGIPGTVGGALAMNAGAWGKNISDLVEKIKVMDYNGNIKILSKKEIKFEYRKSSLEKYIILNARIKLYKKNKKEIRDDMKRYLFYRINTQDNSFPNAGCIFKNPPDEVAARLIDSCSLKGKSQGGAFVSLRHANFILNQKNAKASDVLKLMDLIKKSVKQKFNISLEPEIKIWN